MQMYISQPIWIVELVIDGEAKPITWFKSLKDAQGFIGDMETTSGRAYQIRETTPTNKTPGQCTTTGQAYPAN